MVSKFLRNQGVLAVLARKGTAIPSSANKKRDSLSTVSLVGEAGLEAVLCKPTCHRSTGKGRCFSPIPSTTRRPDDQKALSQPLQKPAAIPLWVTMPPRFHIPPCKSNGQTASLPSGHPHFIDCLFMFLLREKPGAKMHRAFPPMKIQPTLFNAPS